MTTLSDGSDNLPLVLDGHDPPYPAVPSDGTLHYDPVAIFRELCAASGPLRLMPDAKVGRLLGFLQSTDNLFTMFARVADGEPVRGFADRIGIDYYVLSALFESSTPVLKAMREVACRARSREDRDRAREALRKSSSGFTSEGRKRYIDSSLSIAKMETPADFMPATVAAAHVSVTVALGDALVQAHKQRKAAGITVDHAQPARREAAEPSGIDSLL